MEKIIRQIDTGMGLIVGGVVGWLHSTWPAWALLFGVLVAWHYADKVGGDVGNV